MKIKTITLYNFSELSEHFMIGMKMAHYTQKGNK